MARILLADDDNGMRTTLAELLSLEGHQVDAVESGDSVLEQFASQTYDLVVLDQRMPGMTGEEVMDALLKVDPSVRIIMMSAYAVDTLKSNALARGVLAFVDKPLELDTFLDIVRESQRAAILVITEDADTADTVALLRELGYRVRSLQSSSEAIHLAEQIRFDVAIIDCDLAPSDGLETYLALKRVSPHSDAIMLAQKTEQARNIGRAAIARTAYAMVEKSEANARLPGILGRLRAQQASGSPRAKPPSP